MNAGVGIEGDAGRLEVQAADCRKAADAGQDLVDLDRRDVAVVDRLDALLAVFHVHVHRCRVEMDLDAVAGQRFAHHLRGITLFLGQEERLVVNDHGARAEAAKHLRQLAAERAAADHDQTRRQRSEVEDALVGEVAGLREAPDRWQHRARSGGDQRLAKATGRAVGIDLLAVDEARRAKKTSIREPSGAQPK
ncbi:MAG: hypothetical protein ABI364_02965 [Caldimonas sp.]